MLIKTSDPTRQIEKMMEKRARRRRLARRQERDQDEPQTGIAAISPAAHALPGMTASSGARHHAKPQTTILKSGRNATAGRSLQHVQNEARENIFPL